MKVLKMIEKSVNERYVEDIVSSLQDGCIVIAPTDSL